MLAVRPAAVAGMFYPDDAQHLRLQVQQYLAAATRTAADASGAPKLLIVPHAGYEYSGPIAAHAYARIEPLRRRIRRVVLLGPAHRLPVRSLAAPNAQAFDTPFGPVAVDQHALAALRDLPQVVHDDQPHALEHSLEVQLPFLKTVLGAFTLVPLLVGSATPTEVAQVLERLWGGDETLIVISSDLSHYLPHPQARAQDTATVRRILAFDDALAPDQACGALAINGAMVAARHHHLMPHLLDLRDSSDTAGDRRRVVGYTAIAFEERAT
jgi:AmmeMemoRadiSam system protein B